MCQIFVEACNCCYRHTGRFNLIQTCPDYQTQPNHPEKWISGHPSTATTTCQARYDLLMCVVGGWTCDGCSDKIDESSPAGQLNLPKVTRIAQGIADRKELVQLLASIVHIRYGQGIRGLVDKTMDEFGRWRFRLGENGEDGDEKSIYRIALDLVVDQQLVNNFEEMLPSQPASSPRSSPS